MQARKAFVSSETRKRSARALAVVASIYSLSGCLLTSPYWNQSFATHTTAIPIQAQVANNSVPVRIECATAFHGGLYPAFETPVWNFVTSISPQSTPTYAPNDQPVYGAGVKMVLPESCWHQDDGNGIYYTAIRATQGSGANRVEFKTFDSSGLECLGREVGKAASWFGWMGKGCTARYTGTSTDIPYVIIYANN
ncbi:MAG TPA: hypothetical protein VFM46_17605 [Pseudomonadales bacterium]|nr:hypothetical protein [Pseudomonadales bacterium]